MDIGEASEKHRNDSIDGSSGNVGLHKFETGSRLTASLGMLELSAFVLWAT